MLASPSIRVTCRSSTSLSTSLSKSSKVLRGYSSQSTRCKSLSITSSCPYQVLGIDARSESRPKYSQVKSSFVQLALAHHPDRPGGTVNEFLKIRLAFESIRELSDGTSQVVSQHNSSSHLNGDDSSDHDDCSFADWFYHETHLNFHMDSKTRKEVADMVDTLSPGGLDRGGMWEMARTIAREEASKGMRNNQVEMLESGEIKSGTSRRPRRK
jgi:hypothetical protein